MIGNVIVVLAVCASAFYLYRQWTKARNSDNPSCGGCNACQCNTKNEPTTIFESIEEAKELHKNK